MDNVFWYVFIFRKIIIVLIKFFKRLYFFKINGSKNFNIYKIRYLVLFVIIIFINVYSKIFIIILRIGRD